MGYSEGMSVGSLSLRSHQVPFAGTFPSNPIVWTLAGTSTALRSDGVPFAGDSLERSYLFYDRPSRLSSNAPACRGQSRLSGFCVRSPCQHISRMRTFDNNSCAISITSPRSLFRPRTQHGRWGHQEKSRRASTRWDCRGKSFLAGLSPLSGTPSECRK